MQILAELCSLAGAFQTVLTTIHQELVRSVYSTYYSAEAGTLQFSQVGAMLQAIPGPASAVKAICAKTCSMASGWAPGLLNAKITSSTFAKHVLMFVAAKLAIMPANAALQVPFFVAVERLEQEKRHLLQERETFKRALMRRQVN